MTIEQLLRAVHPIVAFDARALSEGQVTLQQTCTGVTHDSRRVGSGAIFAALVGLKANGAVFAPQAICFFEIAQFDGQDCRLNAVHAAIPTHQCVIIFSRLAMVPKVLDFLP